MRFLRIAPKVLVLVLLALSYFDPKVPGQSVRRFRTYLVDVSQSVGVDRSALEFINYDVRKLRPDDWAAVAVFAERCSFVVDPRPAGQVPIVERLEADVGKEATDLDGALDAVLFHQREGYVGEVVLFSDGNFERFRDRDIRVYAIPIGAAKGFDARFAFVHRPASVLPQETFDVEVGVVASAEGTTTVTLGTQQHEITVLPGMVRTVRFEGLRVESELTEFEVTLSDDLRPENNRMRFAVQRRGARPRALIVSPYETSPTAALIRDSFDVTTTFAALDGIDVAILENAAVSKLTREQQEALADYVRQAGGGMVIIGGENAYAAGGMAGTPVEDVSPVWAFPDERVSVVFVLDTSGSMSVKLQATGQKKIEAASRAIIEAAKVLEPGDYAGIVGFSSGATVIRPLSDAKDRVALEEALSKIMPQDATNVCAGVRRGVEVLREAPTALRRMIVVTDGETQERLDEFRAVASIVSEARIKTAVVATSLEPDMDKLRVLSDTVVSVVDFAKLPQALRDLMSRSRELVAENGRARRKVDHPLTSGGDFAVARFNRVSPKKDAIGLYDAERGPIVTLRQAGQGRAVALSYGVTDGWTGSSTVLRDAIRFVTRASSGRLEVVVAPPHVRVAGVPVDDSVAQVQVNVRDPEGRWKSVSFVRNSVSTFEAELALNTVGTYVFRASGAEGRYDVTCPKELERVLIDIGTLDRMAKAMGGRVISDARGFSENPPETRTTAPVSARPYLLATALALFLLDVLVGTLVRRI